MIEVTLVQNLYPKAEITFILDKSMSKAKHARRSATHFLKQTFFVTFK